MEPLRATEHLRELGTDRRVDWAIDWVTRLARLLVEVDLIRRAAEFVPFNHMSGGCAIRRM